NNIQQEVFYSEAKAGIKPGYGVLRLFEFIHKRVESVTMILSLGWTPLLGSSRRLGNILKIDHTIVHAMGTPVEAKP
ncbi:MAG: hypothetical protein GY934_23925, partial [Gammaproteobacteria bacterium]|nr:hypothetical protein [Gammaproteobacteria bacterium]